MTILTTLTTLAMINITVRTAMAMRATVPESFSTEFGNDGCELEPLFPSLSAKKNTKRNRLRLIYFLFKYLAINDSSPLVGFSPSSMHVCKSSRSFNPVGQAHEILALRASICGAGKHKCEQWPLTAEQ